MADIFSRHFQTRFLDWKLLYLDYNFIEMYPLASNKRYSSTGSDDGLAPVRRQAIIWTNHGLV